MHRTHNLEELIETVAPYLHEMEGFYPKEWLEDERNVAISDGEGNFNLLQYISPGRYYAHTFYRSARGKTAVRLAREATKYAFEKLEVTPKVEAMIGMTPEDKVAARWLSRQAGFYSHGMIDTIIGPCELFVLTRTQYEEK